MLFIGSLCFMLVDIIPVWAHSFSVSTLSSPHYCPHHPAG